MNTANTFRVLTPKDLYAIDNLRKRYAKVLARPASEERTLVLSWIKEQGYEYGVDVSDITELNRVLSEEAKAKRQPHIKLVDPPKTGVFDCKVRFDGSQYIATRNCDYIGRKVVKHDKTVFDEIFLILYEQCKFEGIDKDMLAATIAYRLVEWYCYVGSESVDQFVERKLWNLTSAYTMRRNRFHAKRDMIKWQYLYTQTYDDKLMTEDEFKKKAKKELNNLHTRYGWKYIAVFERGEENNRLHLHAVLYCSNGMPGKLVEVWRWSEKEKRMRITLENTFLKSRFGNNEFDRLTSSASVKSSFDYVFKYVTKDKSPLIYSRGLPSHTVMQLTSECFNVGYEIRMKRKITKYVIFPNAVRRLDIGLEQTVPSRPPKNLFELLARATG